MPSIPASRSTYAPRPPRRVNEARRAASGPADEVDAGATQLSSLNASLLQDLLRFGPPTGAPERSDGIDLLEVMAASLRHSRALLLHLQLDYRVMPLSVWPATRTLQSTVPLRQLIGLRLPELRVLRVQPARRAEPDPPHAPLGPLLWELAMRGARSALLPEIAGVATYRVAPGAELGGLDLSGMVVQALMRLRLQTTPLREIATFPGFDHDRATRLLNGLYLHSALIVSRSHPGALSGL